MPGFEKEPVTIPGGEGMNEAIDNFAKEVDAVKKTEVSNDYAETEANLTKKAEAVVIKEYEAMKSKKAQESAQQLEKNTLNQKKQDEQRVEAIMQGLMSETDESGRINVGDDLTKIAEEDTYDKNKDIEEIIENLKLNEKKVDVGDDLTTLLEKE